MVKLEGFIALFYARGLYGKSQSVKFLWDKTYGPRIFGETMSRNLYEAIQRHLRFDIKSTRSARLATDKFAAIREVVDEFSHNCRVNYQPSYSLTIDEQLMPVRFRSRFITFMPNKPDKYGIKFWLLVEVESKYVCNFLPYLGKHEKEARGNVPLGQDVVLRLIEPLKNKGYNVTTDNFFTSSEYCFL